VDVAVMLAHGGEAIADLAVLRIATSQQDERVDEPQDDQVAERQPVSAPASRRVVDAN
jgi:hypothetical protein